ncbi:MAG: hypothetical protein ACTSV5_11195 [Promethearchaeota archaeon]
MTFIPFYFLEVVNVDRSSLAFIKFFTSVPLLLPIFTGYLYDRYITNVKRLNLIFSTFFTLSFLVFLLDPQNLFFFGGFYSINLISQFMIRGGMTKIFMALTITNKPHYTESIREFRIRRKNKFLLILNIGSILGSTLTAIVTMFISNLREQADWNVFFLCGFIFSLPIIISSMMFQKLKLPCIDPGSKIPIIKEKLKFKKRTNILKLFPGFLPIILLYVSFFLTDASLVSMLYMSWFSIRFGDEFIRIAFIFFPVSYVLMMSGNLLVVRFLNKLRTPKEMRQLENRCKKIRKHIIQFNRFVNERLISLKKDYDLIAKDFIKKYKKKERMDSEVLFFFIGISSQTVVILLVIIVKNPIVVFILYFIILPFLGPIETLSKASMSQKMSQEGKHPTLRMQFLTTAYTLGSMIFSPIGLILSTLVSINIIFYVHLIFYGFSFVPFLLSSKIAEKNRIKKERLTNIILLEKIEAIEKKQYS